MEQGKMDRRQRRTRKLIYEAFADLMKANHYGEVTVADIIERADIGRSTFYAHFETKDDLLDQMCVELFNHIFEGVNEQCQTHIDLDASDFAGILAHLLYHLRDVNGGVCGKLLVEHEPHFVAKFDEHFSTLLERYFGETAGVPYDLQLSVMTASFVQTLNWWFSHGAVADPKEVAHTYLNMWKEPV